MPNKKTLFVIGAGASNEVNLPTGKKLKEKIRNSINFEFSGRNLERGNPNIFQAILSNMQKNSISGKNLDDYLDACKQICNALPLAISIDNFVDQHAGDELIEYCAKLAIVSAILEAERNSKFFIDPEKHFRPINFGETEKTWYNSFFKLLTSNCTYDKLHERFNSVSLIIFNYDRCMEHFIYNALQTSYGIDGNAAAGLVNDLAIFHPYGVVGNLPWRACSENSVEFGRSADPHTLHYLSEKIITFTEGTNPKSSQIIRTRETVRDANVIIFLGFAYHELNLKLISPDTEQKDFRRKASVFGTASGISQADCEVIKTDIMKLCNNRINPEKINIRNDLRCAELFNEYWRSLSISS